MKIRGFEVVKGYEDKHINMPIRMTRYSAGYDIEAAEDVIIHPFKLGDKPTLIPTGLKAYMMADECLLLLNRSSGPKKGFVLANSVGLIDSDYYNNETNDGHLFFAFYNVLDHDLEVKKGDIIGQAIFQKFLMVDNDVVDGNRISGFGSTDKH